VVHLKIDLIAIAVFMLLLPPLLLLLVVELVGVAN